VIWTANIEIHKLKLFTYCPFWNMSGLKLVESSENETRNQCREKPTKQINHCPSRHWKAYRHLLPCQYLLIMYVLLQSTRQPT